MTQAQAAPDVAAEITVIQPSRGWSWAKLKELWRYRELLFFLTWRDVKVRYKQTLLGAAWAILKPFFTMVIFTVIFGNLAGIPTDDAPAPIFYYAGLLPWTLFQDGITKASTSMVTNRNLITKVYFPRAAIPLSSIIGGLVDFGLAMFVLAGMMLFFGYAPSGPLWASPLFLMMGVLTALGVGLWLAALNVTYRDVGYVTPFIVQAWLYASPVAYSATLLEDLPRIGQLAYGLNPMAGVIQGFRWSLLGVGQPEPGMLALSIGAVFVLLASGAWYFRRTERTFADIV